MRLNAFLARAGVTSRRGGDGLIKDGRVSVNGKTGQLNTDVNNGDKVLIDGKPIVKQKLRYILLNKPGGYVTTLKDPQGRKTVVELIDIPERVVPVGRLDYDTTGALLLTNDGELAHKLMHPSFEFKKTYQAEVKGIISNKVLKILSNGLVLEDGKTSPAEVRKLSDNKIELTIHEGRKHQVKRMLSAVGLPVINLHRSTYGELTVDGLKPGQWRYIDDKEYKSLIG